MLDGVSLDQLRTFLAAADAGSFSAAGRRLGRAQSVVSQTLGALERQLGVQLFDRSARYPMLTDAGTALVPEARAVAGRMDVFKARARDLAGGLEAELSVAIDVMFPIQIFTHAVTDFQATFPHTPLRVDVEALGAVIQPVIDRRCAFAVVGTLPLVPPELAQERLLSISMLMVAAPGHPLATRPGPIPRADLAEHVQLVLTDRSDLSRGKEFGVLSPKTWRLADLGAKLAFLRAGLGWGSMPSFMVEADLAEGRLVELAVEDAWPEGNLITMFAVHRRDTPPGPAGRWLIERLKGTASLCPGQEGAA
ncbi:MAG: bacterial regulatory helix-turn-helix, lysR family protein [Sphingomonas bacterium]|uniref:LysR family transcriptional regulator n=1 Tax=Sphingomonas bacterium TaxID=1895847 RepID=UPI00260D6BE0|nr:LysR family transcriptional regulator [Sphingomonas bacterium]MDB5704634.1 bacterial regulatory helix-turn-helix, lysR family protein [Sphingomonas bacterium]